MADSLFTRDDFLEQVRNEYPEYNAWDDESLYNSLLDKYPQYKEIIDETPPEPPKQTVNAGNKTNYTTSDKNSSDSDEKLYTSTSDELLNSELAKVDLEEKRNADVKRVYDAQISSGLLDSSQVSLEEFALTYSPFTVNPPTLSDLKKKDFSGKTYKDGISVTAKEDDLGFAPSGIAPSLGEMVAPKPPVLPHGLENIKDQVSETYLRAVLKDEYDVYLQKYNEYEKRIQTREGIQESLAGIRAKQAIDKKREFDKRFDPAYFKPPPAVVHRMSPGPKKDENFLNAYEELKASKMLPKVYVDGELVEMDFDQFKKKALEQEDHLFKLKINHILADKDAVFVVYDDQLQAFGGIEAKITDSDGTQSIELNNSGGDLGVKENLDISRINLVSTFEDEIFRRIKEIDKVKDLYPWWAGGGTDVDAHLGKIGGTGWKKYVNLLDYANPNPLYESIREEFRHSWDEYQKLLIEAEATGDNDRRLLLIPAIRKAFLESSLMYGMSTGILTYDEQLDMVITLMQMDKVDEPLGATSEVGAFDGKFKWEPDDMPAMIEEATAFIQFMKTNSPSFLMLEYAQNIATKNADKNFSELVSLSNIGNISLENIEGEIPGSYITFVNYGKKEYGRGYWTLDKGPEEIYREVPELIRYDEDSFGGFKIEPSVSEKKILLPPSMGYKAPGDIKEDKRDMFTIIADSKAYIKSPDFNKYQRTMKESITVNEDGTIFQDLVWYLSLDREDEYGNREYYSTNYLGENYLKGKYPKSGEDLQLREGGTKVHHKSSFTNPGLGYLSKEELDNLEKTVINAQLNANGIQGHAYNYETEIEMFGHKVSIVVLGTGGNRESLIISENPVSWTWSARPNDTYLADLLTIPYKGGTADILDLVVGASQSIVGATRTVTAIPAGITKMTIAGIYGAGNTIADLWNLQNPAKGYQSRWGETMHEILNLETLYVGTATDIIPQTAVWTLSPSPETGVLLDVAFYPVTKGIEYVHNFGDYISESMRDYTGGDKYRWIGDTVKVGGEVGVMYFGGRYIYNPLLKRVNIGMNNPGMGSYKDGTVAVMNHFNPSKGIGNFLTDKAYNFRSKITNSFFDTKLGTSITNKFGFGKDRYSLRQTRWRDHRSYNMEINPVKYDAHGSYFETVFDLTTRTGYAGHLLNRGTQLIRRKKKLNVNQDMYKFKNYFLPKMLTDMKFLNHAEFLAKYKTVMQEFGIKAGDILRWSRDLEALFPTKGRGDFYKQKLLQESNPIKYEKLYNNEGKGNFGSEIPKEIINDNMFIIKGKNPTTNKYVVQVKNNKSGEIIVNEQFSTNTAAVSAMGDMSNIVANWGALHSQIRSKYHTDNLINFLDDSSQSIYTFAKDRALISNPIYDHISVKTMKIAEQNVRVINDIVSDILIKNEKIFKRMKTNVGIRVVKEGKGLNIFVDILIPKKNRAISKKFAKKNGSDLWNKEDGYILKANERGVYTTLKNNEIINHSLDLTKGKEPKIYTSTPFREAYHAREEVMSTIQELANQKAKIIHEIQKTEKAIKNKEFTDIQLTEKDVKALKDNLKEVDIHAKNAYKELEKINKGLESGNIQMSTIFNGNNKTGKITEKPFNPETLYKQIFENSPAHLAMALNPKIWKKLMENKDYRENGWKVATTLIDSHVKKFPDTFNNAETIMFRRHDAPNIKVPEIYNIAEKRYYSPLPQIAELYAKTRKGTGDGTMHIPEIDIEYGFAKLAPEAVAIAKTKVELVKRKRNLKRERDTLQAKEGLTKKVKSIDKEISKIDKQLIAIKKAPVKKTSIKQEAETSGLVFEKAPVKKAKESIQIVKIDKEPIVAKPKAPVVKKVAPPKKEKIVENVDIKKGIVREIKPSDYKDLSLEGQRKYLEQSQNTIEEFIKKSIEKRLGQKLVDVGFEEVWDVKKKKYIKKKVSAKQQYEWQEKMTDKQKLQLRKIKNEINIIDGLIKRGKEYNNLFTWAVGKTETTGTRFEKMPVELRLRAQDLDLASQKVFSMGENLKTIDKVKDPKTYFHAKGVYENALKEHDKYHRPNIQALRNNLDQTRTSYRNDLNIHKDKKTDFKLSKAEIDVRKKSINKMNEYIRIIDEVLSTKELILNLPGAPLGMGMFGMFNPMKIKVKFKSKTYRKIMTALPRLLQAIENGIQVKKFQKSANILSPEEIDFIIDENNFVTATDVVVDGRPDLHSRFTIYNRAENIVYEMDAKKHKHFESAHELNTILSDAVISDKIVDKLPYSDVVLGIVTLNKFNELTRKIAPGSHLQYSWDVMTYIENEILLKRVPGSKGAMDMRVGNPFRSKDTALNLHKRVHDNSFLMRAAKKTRELFDEVLKDVNTEMRKLGQEDWIQFLGDYVPHFWDLTLQQKNNFVNKWGKTPHGKQRKLPTIAEGIKLGYKPKAMDIGEIARTYIETNYTIIRNAKLLDLLRNTKDIHGHPVVITKQGHQKIVNGLKADIEYNKKLMKDRPHRADPKLIERLEKELSYIDIKRYAEFSDDFVLRIIGEAIKDKQVVRTGVLESVLIHKDYSAVVDPYKKNRFVTGEGLQKAGKFMRTINSLSKGTFFLFTMFHPIALLESANASLMRMHKPWTWFRGVLMFEKHPITGKMMWGRRPTSVGKEIQKYYGNEATGDGLKLGAKGSGDFGHATIEKALVDFAKWSQFGRIPLSRIPKIGKHFKDFELTNSMISKVAAPLVKTLTTPLKLFVNQWNKWLWDHHHDGYKMMGWYDLKYNVILKEFPEADKRKVGKVVAENINDLLGSQNPYQMPRTGRRINWRSLWSNPRIQRVGQLLLLASDWSFSVQGATFKGFRRRNKHYKRWFNDPELLKFMDNNTYRKYLPRLALTVWGSAKLIQWAIYEKYGDSEKGDKPISDDITDIDIDVTPLLRDIMDSGALAWMIPNKSRRLALEKKIKDGQRFETSFGKQLKEATSWWKSTIEGAVAFGLQGEFNEKYSTYEFRDAKEEFTKIWLNKTGPLVHFSYETFVGESLTGYKEGYSAENLYPEDSIYAWLNSGKNGFIGLFTPATFEGQSLLFALPIRQAYSKFQFRKDIQDALTLYCEDLYRVKLELKAGYKPHVNVQSYDDYIDLLTATNIVPQIVKEAKANGYNVPKIFRDELNRKKRTYSRKIYELINPANYDAEGINLDAVTYYSLALGRLHETEDVIIRKLAKDGIKLYDKDNQKLKVTVESIIENWPYEEVKGVMYKDKNGEYKFHKGVLFYGGTEVERRYWKDVLKAQKYIKAYGFKKDIEEYYGK